MAAPDLDHVRTFATVYRAGSLSDAARLLGLSQSTVSEHVRALEASLGAPLFTRARSGMTPTPKGSEFAASVLAHVDALDDALSLAAARPTSALHVGGPAELLSTRVVPRLGDVVAAVGAPVHLRFGLLDDLVDALRARELDLVVGATRPRAAGIEAVPLIDEEFVLVAAPLFAGRAIEGIPAVAYAEELPIVRRYWRSVFGRRPTGLDVAAVVPDLRGVADAVVSGLGMSVLPDYLVADHLAAGRLVVLHEPEVAPLNTVYLVRRSGEPRPDLRLASLEVALRAAIG